MTFIVTDACGNADNTTATFTITDYTPPVISVNIPEITIPGCSTADITGLTFSTMPVTITPAQLTTAGGTATDNCGIQSITYVDAQIGTCPIVVTRTYTVTDQCNRTASTTETYTIERLDTLQSRLTELLL